MRRFRSALIAASALLLLGAACSSDDDSDDAATEDDPSVETTASGSESDSESTEPGDEGGGDADDFCTLLASDADVDPLTDEGQEMMAEILATAPDELQEPIETLFGVFEQMEGIDEDDEEAFGEVFALMFDPEIIAATEEIEDWGVENCGLEEGFFTGEGDFSDEDDTEGGADDGGTDDGALSGASFKDWIDENDPDVAWAEGISTWAQVNDQLYLNGEIDVDGAIEACEAAFAWADETGEDLGGVTVGTSDNEDLVVGEDGVCEPV